MIEPADALTGDTVLMYALTGGNAGIPGPSRTVLGGGGCGEEDDEREGEEEEEEAGGDLSVSTDHPHMLRLSGGRRLRSWIAISRH